MRGAFVVIWRPDEETAWHVQPNVHDEAQAECIGGQLLRRFGGEAWALPVELPPGEDTND